MIRLLSRFLLLGPYSLDFDSKELFYHSLLAVFGIKGPLDSLQIVGKAVDLSLQELPGLVHALYRKRRKERGYAQGGGRRVRDIKIVRGGRKRGEGTEREKEFAVLLFLGRA